MQRDKHGTSPQFWAGIDGGSDAQRQRDGLATIPPRGSEVGLVAAEVAEQTAPTCLVLEDDAVLRRLLLRHLSHRGFKVTGAQNLAEARAALAERSFHFLLSDSMLPDGSGLDLVAEVLDNEGPLVLVMSGDKRARFGLGHHAAGFLLKPFSMQNLDTSLSVLEGQRRLAHVRRRGVDLERVERFRTRYIPELGGDVGALAALDALAGLRCPVVLVSSDAKLARLAASALHDAGGKGDEPFVVLAGEKLHTAAELDAQIHGLEAGTLVLERVERMPLAVQGRLATLLTEGELERVAAKERLRLRSRAVLTLGNERETLVRSGQLHPELAPLLGRLEVQLAPASEASA